MLEGVRKAGGEAEYIHLPSYHIEGCIGCEKCRKEKRCTQFFDGMQLLYPKIEKRMVLSWDRRHTITT